MISHALYSLFSGRRLLRFDPLSAFQAASMFLALFTTGQALPPLAILFVFFIHHSL